jgi:hypothetical protein
MSYIEFTTELSDEYGALRNQAKAPDAADFERADRRVFDRWLAADRCEELIEYLIENYDGKQGGEGWFRLLGQRLAKMGRSEQLRELYRPIIELRQNRYLSDRARLQKRWPVILDPLLNNISRRRRELANYKQSILDLMQEFRTLAVSAGSDPDEIAEIDRKIVSFDRGT